MFKELYVYCISSVFWAPNPYEKGFTPLYNSLWIEKKIRVQRTVSTTDAKIKPKLFFIISYIQSQFIYLLLLNTFPPQPLTFYIRSIYKKMGNVYKKSQILFL